MAEKAANKEAIVGLTNAALALCTGGLYYLIRRPEARLTQIVGVWFDLRTAVPKWMLADSPGWQLIDCYGADFLWAYALTCLVNVLVGYAPGTKCFAICMCLAADVGMELMQLMPEFGGTFDMWDIAAQVGATVIAQASIELKRRSAKHERE